MPPTTRMFHHEGFTEGPAMVKFQPGIRKVAFQVRPLDGIACTALMGSHGAASTA